MYYNAYVCHNQMGRLKLEASSAGDKRQTCNARYCEYLNV